MELTAVAEWLNTSFSGFDHAILSVLHELALLTNGNLNWLFKFISLFAEKGLFLILLSIFLMGVSRNYLMVHYPTDVIGGMISGLVGATIAYFITLLIYKIIEKYKDVKLFNFIKNFDIINAMKK